MEFLYESGEESLRLIGIDSPEGGECFGPESMQRLSELVSGVLVSLVMDESDRDQLGRLFRYVYVGDEFVNATLVREGFAIARRYPPDTAMAAVLEAAQAEAMAAGLWAPEACDVAAGMTSRSATSATTPTVTTTRISTTEWVEFHSQGEGPVDPTGWAVKDEPPVTGTGDWRVPPGGVGYGSAAHRVRRGHTCRAVLV